EETPLLERYENVIMEKPQQVARYLFEQERIEALRRGLNGRLVLNREVLWQTVADVGLWGTASAGLGALRANSDIELALLDNPALGATVQLDPSSLGLKQLRRALLELLRIEEIESAYEQQELGEIELAVEGIEPSLSSGEDKRSQVTLKTMVSTPLQSWSPALVAKLFAAAGAASSGARGINVDGAELAALELQGQHSLDEGLCALGVDDPVVRQRLEYQISLLQIRSIARKTVSATEDDIDGGHIAALEDPCWWAGTGFGVRARKALDQWTVDDVQRFIRTLRLGHGVQERFQSYAIDGKSLQELEEEEMMNELALTSHEATVLGASIILLSRSPELGFGSSDFLKLRISNQHESVWTCKNSDNLLCLSIERVHKVILRPSQRLCALVNSVSAKRPRNANKTAVRVWYRVLEYSQVPKRVVAPTSKPGIDKSKSNSKIKPSATCSSFTDAGHGSVTQIMREATCNAAKGERLTRWDPLHPLIKAQTGIVNGWRFLGTSSIERGTNEEFARLSLAFDARAVATAVNNPDSYFRLCFVFQIGTFATLDATIKTVPVPLENGEHASHLFTLSPSFRLGNPSAGSAPGTRRQQAKKKRRAMPSRTRAKAAKDANASKIRVASGNQRAAPEPKAAPRPPRKETARGKPRTQRTEAKSLKELRKVMYSEHAQNERLEKLEKTQLQVSAAIESAVEAKLSPLKANAVEEELKRSAAFHLGALVGRSVEVAGVSGTIEPSTVIELREEARSKLRELQDEWDRNRSWVQDMETIQAERPEPKQDIKEEDVNGSSADPEADSAWANRVRSQFLATGKDVATYPLRPSTAGTAERCIKKLRLAVSRLGAKVILDMFRTIDGQRTGWVDQDQFKHFVHSVGHPDLLAQVSECLEALHKSLSDVSRPCVSGRGYKVRYERLVYSWTHDDKAYGQFLARRLWERAELCEFELLYFIERSETVESSVLREVDPDVSGEEIDLLRNCQANGNFLNAVLLRSNPEKLWRALVSKMKERPDEELENLARHGADEVRPAGKGVHTAHFARKIAEWTGVQLTEEELATFSRNTGAGVGFVDISEVRDKSAVDKNFDLRILLSELESLDSKGTGIVSGGDMYQALRGAFRLVGAQRDASELVRKYAMDFEKRHMPYVRWLGLTFQVSHDQVIEAELRRLGRWFALQEESKQRKVLARITESPCFDRAQTEHALADVGFKSTLLYDLCACAGAISGEDDVVVLEKVLARALKLGVGDRAAATTLRRLESCVTMRLVRGAGGVGKVLASLSRADSDGAGVVQVEDFAQALECSVDQLDVELLGADLGGTVQYESVLEELAQEHGYEKRFAEAFVRQKFKRAMKRCKITVSTSLYDLLLSHDEQAAGKISIHELSWALRTLDVHVDTEGPEADFLLKQFAGALANAGHDIDYERVIHACEAGGETEADRAAKEEAFFVHYFRRRLRQLASKFTGMLHVLDASPVGVLPPDGKCTVEDFRKVLLKAFNSSCQIERLKLDLAVKYALHHFTEESSSGSHLVSYEKFALAISSTSEEQARHEIVRSFREVSNACMDLFAVLRAYDGDLDGTISIRNFNRAFANLGASTVLSLECFEFLDALVDPGVVDYEVFIERAQALESQSGSKDAEGESVHSFFSAERLRSCLQRINAKALRSDAGPRTTRELFESLLHQSERPADDMFPDALSEWDIFFLLREHQVNLQTIEELSRALKGLLALVGSSRSPLMVDVVAWLRIVA
ncbi:Uncharacterized protein SCF082_LOCUS52921, partial [Durusdinium trenchii]